MDNEISNQLILHSFTDKNIWIKISPETYLYTDLYIEKFE